MYRIYVFVVAMIAIQSQGVVKGEQTRSLPYAKTEITELKRNIDNIISDKRAIVGVAIGTDEYDVLTLNNNIHFPLMSVFKFHIALAVLDKLDKNKTPLDSMVFIEKSKLLHNTYSPIVKEFPNQDLTLSIGKLINYCVSHSDNNACDLLIEYMGGISKVEEYIMGLGIKDLNLKVPERTMHDDIMMQYANWSTTQSAVNLMKIFLNRELFAKHYKDFLIQAMTDTSTGKNKLKALLPQGVVVAHKTGSSNRTEKGVQIAENDMAFINLPDGGRYYISVFVKDSKETDEVNINIIARISETVYNFFCKNHTCTND